MKHGNQNYHSKKPELKPELVNQLLSYRSGSAGGSSDMMLDSVGPVSHDLTDYMSHAEIALNLLLRRRDFAYVFVPEVVAQPAGWGHHDEDQEPMYRPLIPGYYIPAIPGVPEHVRRCNGDMPASYKELITAGYFSADMQSLVIACGGTTISITLRPDKYKLGETPIQIEDSTTIYVLVECLSSSGKLREESEIEFSFLKDNVGNQFRRMIMSILTLYIRSSELAGGLGKSSTG